MTNLIKRKGLLSLIAVIIMIAIMSVACKKKVTQPMDFSVTEEVINGAEDNIDNNSDSKDAVDNKDSVDNKDTTDNKNKVNDGTFYNGYFKVTVKHPEIRIEYKDWFGGQGSLVIKAEGKSSIKSKNSIFGFNFIINGVKLFATDATPNYDANGNLVSITFSSRYTGRTKEVKF